MGAAVKPGSKFVIFHCPAPVRDWLEKTAAKNYSTITGMVIRSIHEAMARDKRRGAEQPDKEGMKNV